MRSKWAAPDKVARQHKSGRLTVRERIDKLVDEGTFQETGTIAGLGEYEPNGDLKTVTPANCVFGRAKVDGRPVVVVGDDFTVRGGSADAAISAKPLMPKQTANAFRLPIIRVIEGSGGGGSVKTIETKGASNLPGGVGGTRGFYYMTENLAHVPVVGARARLGRGPRRRAPRVEPLLRHDKEVGDVRRRPAGGGAARRAVGERRSSAAGRSRRARAASIMRRRRKKKRSNARERFLSYLPSSVHELPPTVAATTIRSAPTRR